MSNVKVKYVDDGIIYEVPVCHVKQRSGLKVGDQKKVKWKDGKFYDAVILEVIRNEQQMETLKKNTCETLPLMSHSNNDNVNLINTNEKLPETTTLICTLFEDKKKIKIRENKNCEFVLAKATDCNNEIKTNDLELEKIPFICTLFEDKKSISARTEEPRIVLSNSNFFGEKRKIDDAVDQTRKKKRKAAENVNYQNLCVIDELYFSPHESEYEPEEDSKTSDDDSKTSDEDRKTSENYREASEKGIFNIISDDSFFKSNQIDIPLRNETKQKNLQSGNDAIEPLASPLINPQVSATSVTNNDLQIDLAKKKPNGKRVFDKKYMCKYCHKLYLKLPRHLEDKHEEEIEVAKFLSMPVGSKERKEIIEQIRLGGEKIFNFSCFSDKMRGKIITKRRPTKEEDVCNYLPCELCGSFLKNTYLARHIRECSHRAVNNEPNSNPGDHRSKNRSIQCRAALLLPSAPHVPQQFKENILEKMTYDEVYSEMTKDNLIIEFGKKLFETKKKRPSQFREVKDRMRELGRLLMVAKKNSDKVKCLTDLIDPTMYNVIIEATKEIAGYNDNGYYDSPSLAIKIGQTLKKCASKYKGMCMDDEVLHHNLRKIELFQQRITENWADDVTKDAHTTLQERLWNAPKRIPLTEDVTKLNKYLTDQENKLIEEFRSSDNRTVSGYRSLCENTLCRVILLNRRRVGEAQYMRLSDYQKATTNIPRDDSEIMETLSEVEKVLVKSLVRVEIRGKRGRMVPVILTPSIQYAISLLIESRNRVGVPLTNDYLFPAIHSSKGHYRADVVLRNVAKSCGATYPNALTGTQLRRHVATMIQLLNLRENELDAVANYLGHDIRVHRQYYRLPHETMQLAKISKLLINMESGNINYMRGQNLDEINVFDEINDHDQAIPDDEEDGNDEFVLRTANQEQMKTVNSAAGTPTEKSHLKRKHTVRKRQKFSFEESTAVKQFFQSYIKKHKVPGQNDVKRFFEAYPNMKDIEWTRVKFHVYNCFASKQKK